ncbi:MAG: hypothetical protein MKZ94_09825, partial [Pirellulales bacterium]|nr:hypothetical protein [Pirellulales bacterium]
KPDIKFILSNFADQSVPDGRDSGHFILGHVLYSFKRFQLPSKPSWFRRYWINNLDLGRLFPALLKDASLPNGLWNASLNKA